MSGFVVGSHFLFFFADHHGTALGTHHDLILGALKILAVDFILVGTCGKKGSFVNQVFQIRS